MKSTIVGFFGHSVELRYPADWESDIQLLFGPSAMGDAEPCARLAVTVTGHDGAFGINEDGAPVAVTKGQSRSEILIQICEMVAARLAAVVTEAVALHAGAVTRNNRAVLIPGPSGAGKSSLTAWFVDKGFGYLTDELAAVTSDGEATGLRRGLMLKANSNYVFSTLSTIAASPNRRLEGNLVLRPDRADDPQSPSHAACSLIIIPTFVANAELSIRPLTPARACMRLMACNVNSSNLADGGLSILSSLARKAPAIELTYGSFDQLDGVVDLLTRLVFENDLDSAQGHKLLAALAHPLPVALRPVRYPIPAPTPRRNSPRLTIGMATYDDYDGVYFTLQSLRIYHPEIINEAEFIVIDNHPDGPCAEPLKRLEDYIPNYRYVPEPVRSGTWVKGRVFDEAAGEFVLCMDSHVLIVPGAVEKLLTYFVDNRKSIDLLQGPLVHDDLSRLATHFRPEWSGGMFGVWDNSGLANDPAAPPFDIPMQGMGLFACRRDAWLGFNEAFRGFGGEEWYIHEKFRRAGGRILCLPFLRWIHRFNRPMGIPYRNILEDRVWNYLVGFSELGLPTYEMEKHFQELFGEPKGREIITRLKQEHKALRLQEATGLLSSGPISSD